MKNFLLLIYFTLLSSLLFSQDYIPLLEGNPIWKVYGTDNSQISEDATTDVEYSLGGDTIIEGTDYKILTVERAESSYSYPFISEAYLRENTDTRQVFLRFQEDDQGLFGDNEELLLYDFSLSEGGSFELYADFEGNEVNILSDTVYTIDGEDRTAWVTDFPLTGSEVEKIYVEGFGFLTDLLMPVLYQEFTFYNAFTYCYTNTLEDLSQEFDYLSVPDEFDCNATLSTFNRDNQLEMLIYPNPSSEDAIVELTDLREIVVSDLLGKVIFENYDIKSDQIEIKNSSWVEGLYLVKACTASGNCAVKRMVVKK